MLMQVHEVLQEVHEVVLYSVVTLIIVSALARAVAEEVRETFKKKTR